MSVELPPEMARSAFRPLLQRLEQNGSGAAGSSGEARALLAGCGIGAAVLEQLLKDIHGMLGAGMETKKLQLIQREFLDCVHLAANQIYPRVHHIVANVMLPEEERKSALETLDGYIKHAKAMEEELKALELWLERAHPSIDISTFNGHKAPLDFDDYEDSKEIEARIRAGGEV